MSCSDDTNLIIWDTPTIKLIGHTATVFCMTIWKSKIISGSSDDTIKIWNLQGQCEATLQGHADIISSLNCLSDGRIVSTADDGTLKIWNSEECLHTFKKIMIPYETYNIIKILDNDRVACIMNDNTINIINTRTYTIDLILIGHTSAIERINTVKDGKEKLITSTNERLIIWNLQTGRIEYLSQALIINDFIVLPDNRIAIANKNKVNVVNIQTKAIDLTYNNGVEFFHILQDKRLIGVSGNEITIYR